MAGQQDYLPSFSQGCARSEAESEHPELWRGLVGAWIPGLGATGDRVFDVSGCRSNGVSQGTGTTRWTASIRGPALYFNGANDCINLGNPAALQFELSDFSIVAFFKAEFGANNSRTIFAKAAYAIGPGRFFLSFDSGSLNVGATDSAGYGFVCAVSESAYLDGQSHSVVGVWNRRHGLELWADGQFKTVNTNLALYPSVSYSTSYVAGIGAYGNTTGTALDREYWLGSIGPVYAYRRVLDVRTIQRLNADPLAPFRLRRSVYASVSTPATRAPCAAYRRVLASTYGVSR